MSGRFPRWTLSTRICGLNTSTKPSRDEQQLRREVDHRERDREPRGLLDAEAILRMTSATMTTMPPTMSQGFSRSGPQKIER